MLFQRFLLTVVGLLLFICASSVSAAEVTVSPMAGGFVFDSERGLKNSPAYSLGLGLNFNQHWSVEGTADYVETEFDGSDTKWNFYSGRIGILYHFTPIDNLTPYLLVGAGVFRFNADDNGQLTYGLGTKLAISENVDLRLEARGAVELDMDKEDLHDTYNHFAFGAGFVFKFGQLTASSPEYQPQADTPDTQLEQSVMPEPEPAPPVEDSDNDGVIDTLDRCPVTPYGTPVDAEGCPKTVKFVDSDNDGVSDVLDACPETPASAEVDIRGCPVVSEIDSDNDGVSDVMDKCPDTAPQIPVDGAGCPELSKKLEIAGLVIEYATSQSGFSEEAAKELKLLSAKVQSTEKGRLLVEGHTDSVGKESYNIKLSQERAEKVRRALIKDFGVAADRVVARGFGPFEPVADNSTQEGRQQNRRVVVRYEP